MLHHKKKEYATVGRSDGVNYREIAEIMTALGYDMNHSSARNNLLRIMRRFYVAYCEAQGITIAEDVVEGVCRSASFQEAVSQFIQQLENQRRTVRSVVNIEPIETIDSGAVKRKVYKSSQGVCVRHRSCIYVPRGSTNVKPGGEVLLFTRGDRVEIHAPGASAEEWILRE